ncbi:GPI transamidase subunit PIG-U-domain containing protein [Nitzschia inconspicua]|uniref:GPI transamidase subunit PIG-U-domain containing protein n=1 Tax=Nitzschia inconspicua TaxID=303405 RepID=A0A9K3LHW0_9STRA|nr:GPI transamidase subunit PIG-U-domain containing protein [Nitzschia inconspicua]
MEAATAAKKKKKPTSTSVSRSQESLWMSPFIVSIILLRLFLITLPNFYHPVSWVYQPSLLSVLVRPRQSLLHLREARAIQCLMTEASCYNNNNNNNNTNNVVLRGSAYLANHSIRIPPLLLFLLLPLLDATTHPELWMSLILLLVDLAIAYLLEKVCENVLIGMSKSQQTRQEEQRQRLLPEVIQPPLAHIFPIYSDADTTRTGTTQSLIPMSTIPRMAALLYFGSPFTILPASLYQCWQNLPMLFVLASIYQASCGTGYYVVSSSLLAVAVYLEPYCMVYSIPAIVLFHISKRRKSDGTSPSLPTVSILFLACLILWSVALQGMAYGIMGSPNIYWNSVVSAYGETWLSTSPNLSMQWYFRMQLFTRFRDYFGAMFWGLPYALIGPLTVRLGMYPDVLIGSFALLWCVYRPVQVLFDANIALCLLLISPRSLARMGLPALISLCSIMVPVLLNIVDHWMWLEANNGNANYIFFQCLAYNVFLGIILGQFVGASVQRDKALRIDLDEYNNETDGKVKDTKERIDGQTHHQSFSTRHHVIPQPFFGDGDNRDSDWEDFEEEAALLNESGGVSQPKDGTSRLCIQGLGQSSSNVGVKNASIKVFTAWRKYRGKLADVSWMEIDGDNLMGYMNEAFCFARESTEGNEQERQESGGALLAGIRRRGSGQRRRDTWDLGHLPCFGILVLSGRWTPPEHGGNTRRDAKCCFSIIAQNRESSTAKLLTQAIQKCLPEDIKSRITSRSLRDTGITELASHGSLSIDDGGARFGHSTGTTQDHYISDQHYLYGLKAGMARAGYDVASGDYTKKIHLSRLQAIGSGDDDQLQAFLD